MNRVLYFVFVSILIVACKGDKVTFHSVEKSNSDNEEISPKAYLIDTSDINLCEIKGDSILIIPGEVWKELIYFNADEIKEIQKLFKPMRIWRGKPIPKDFTGYTYGLTDSIIIFRYDSSICFASLSGFDTLNIFNHFPINKGMRPEEIIHLGVKYKTPSPNKINYVSVGVPYMANKGLELIFVQNKLTNIYVEYWPDGEY